MIAFLPDAWRMTNFPLFIGIGLVLIVGTSHLAQRNHIRKATFFSRFETTQARLEDHFCLYITLQSKGLFSSCVNQQSLETIHGRIKTELDHYFGTSNVQVVGSDSFAVLREFPASLCTHDAEKTEYQTIVAQTISERIARILQAPASDTPPQFSQVIGCAASGIRYRMESLEQLMDLAYYTAMQAKAKQCKLLVADERIRARKLDIDECKQGFLSPTWSNEFNPFFQPIIDSKSFEVIGVESLGRWQLGGFRVLSASIFKDIASELQHLAQIDTIIIQKTFSIIRSYMLLRIIPYSFRIVVNVSDESLTPSFCTFLEELTANHGLNPCQIELDVKDTALSLPQSAQTIQALREKQFRISLDVFHETSFDLHALLCADFDTIKFDFSTYELPLRTVYTALKETASTLGIEVLAKGIESKQVMDTAIALDCEYVQGNYFTPPIPEPTFGIFMKKYQQGLYLDSSLG
ncbi:EAL domain-containing protein [Sphaerochaeta sp.]|uniref:EAL domain-containing protein n=1 Tax=Sphaerochaeta sp. TaxID=1972642 RepID=UPI002FC9035F